jgi:hypothetical protein
VSAPNKRPAFEPASELLKPVHADPDMKRPVSTVAGAALVFLRVLAGIVWIVSVAAGWSNFVRDIDVSFDDFAYAPQLAEVTLLVVMIVIGLFLLADAILALFILRGHNWARVVVMTFSAISISASFLQWWAGGLDIRISTTLLSIGLDILILLALSSRSAAAYARRNEHRLTD